MYKPIILLLVLSFININAQMRFSYFPLENGNKWFFSSSLSGDIQTILEVINDTLMSDGKFYSRVDQLQKNDTLWIKKVGVYFLRVENEILYNFPSDTLLNYDWNDSTSISMLPEGFTEVRVKSLEVFNENRLTYFLYIYYPYEYISFTDSIGFNALYALEWRDWLNQSRYLVGCIINNNIYGSIITEVKSDKKNNLNGYRLYQNYPNPFNPTTKIKYSIPKSSFVTIKVFDLLGREVVTLVNDEKTNGNYEIDFNGSNLSSGIYFYKMQAGDFIDIKRMILLR